MRTQIFNEDYILKVAKEMIENNLSLDEASSIYDIPKSTLYGSLKNISNVKVIKKLDTFLQKKTKDTKKTNICRKQIFVHIN